ncbi:D-alanyl-D-alanine-carboxypeptidase/endopeptidase AmpH [Terriglobus sp. 2YAB30_2]|uniref:D-alanyl-D-alanine- carboxypeptidase/endopeptidase AmpH n=1 Tax=unclassified Terriglobus TaxID=2628988 RepID=UPI003F99BCC2
MRRARLRYLLPVLLSLCGVPSASAKAAAASTALPALQNAEEMGQDLFVLSGSVGMVLVVVRDDKVFFHGYGETAPGSHQLPSQDSVLRLCSLTKIFTTDVLSKLATDRVVRLDDPLQQYAPKRIVVPTRGDSPITLVDLATHTAGLSREIAGVPPHTPHFTYPDYKTRWRWLPKQRLHNAPGSSALYSNVGFDLLSDALSSATHKQYASLLADRTLNPLHMVNTTFFPNDVQCSKLLVSAHDEGPCTVTENTAGSSGLYSTATDMAIWLKYLLRSGDNGMPAQDKAAQDVYLPPEKLVHQVGLDHAGMPSGVGLGWIHLLPTDDPSHIVQKTGGGAGFRTYIAINQAHHTAVFLAATDGPAGTGFNLFYGANDLLLSMAGLPPLPPPPARLVVVKKTVHRVAKPAPRRRRR